MKRTQQHRPELSHQARSVTASARPPGVTISRMDTLRRRGQPENAVALLRESLAADPAAAVGLLALLRAAARVDDARLLLELARAGGPALCSRVADALSEAGAADEAQYLFSSLEQVDLSTLISMAAPLSRGRDTLAQHVSAQGTPHLRDVLLRRPVDEFVTTIEQLRRQQRPDEAGKLLDVLCEGSPQQAVAAARGLALRGLTSDARFVIDAFARRAGPSEAASAFVALARFWPEAAAVNATALADRPDAVAVVQMLEDAGRQHPGAQPLAELVRALPAKSIARLCHALCGAETYDHVEAILTQCAERADRDELRMALYELDLHSAAFHLARRARSAPLANPRRPAEDDWR